MSLLLLNLSLSMMLMFMSHPLSMGLILLMQTLTISLITGKLCMNYWFSYILFLILVGGMMVLFMYMTSVASNEKFSFNLSILMISIIPLMTMMMTDKIMYWNSTSIYNNMNMMNMPMKINSSMIKYIHMPMNMIMLFLIIYLLVTLIVIVKIINMSHGPLRMKN